MESAEVAAHNANEILTQAQAEVEAAERTLADLRQQMETCEAARREADRAVDRLQTRFELLERLRNEGAGYASGVRAVLQAGAEHQKANVKRQTSGAGLVALPGIVGTVASVIQVPAELDKAIETALGGAFQNVITETWDDTHRAIDYLKAGRGRATFLPLDRISAGRAIPAPNASGILGNALDLVDYDPSLEAAIASLLNRTWIAQDMPSARRALDANRGSQPTVVTLDGEIIRPGGAVTGGNDSRRQDESILAREREYRRLPAQISAARSQADTQAATHRSLSAQIEAARAEINQAREAERSTRQTERLAQSGLAAAKSRLAQAMQTVGWQRELMENRHRSVTQLDAQEATYQAELAQWQSAQSEGSEAVAAAEAAVEAQGITELLNRLAELRAAAAEAQGTWRSRQAVFNESRRSLESVSAQIRSRGERAQALQAEIETLRSQISAKRDEESRVATLLAAVQGQIEPAAAELGRLEASQIETESEERRLQGFLRHEESTSNAAQLHFQRAEDRLAGLRDEIRLDFGLADLEESEETAYQPPLPLEAIVAQLPVLADLPDGLESEVHEMRARLRRLINVNPDAPKEYEEAAGRHDFLLTQSADLQAAAADLQRVIRELDRQMEEALRQTFAEVSKEFVHYFGLLFRGGTASLSLTNAEDIINTGVEIIARPPGKRPQSLELLSGGERSLTACALIFAILRVSPTPFCILDEVDAALDEANVDRFRTVLEGLVERTQFIIITHNRRTLEASNTIYGITMGDDGISRVISLRLEGDEMVEVKEAERNKVAEAEVVAM